MAGDDIQIRVPKRTMLGLLTAAVLAGGGTSYTLMYNLPETLAYENAQLRKRLVDLETKPTTRADPFTGTQGAALEHRIRSLEILCASFPMGFQADAPEQMRRNTMEIARFNDRCTFAQEQIRERDQRLAERIAILEEEHKRIGGHK